LETLFAYATKAGPALASINRKCQTYLPLTNLAAIYDPVEFSANKYSFLQFENISAMNQQATASQKTRAEQETENEANRLREQINAALTAVALRSRDEIESLQTAADRIDRAARDLADALRQLARQRKAAEDS
jgi:predicted deacetylase